MSSVPLVEASGESAAPRLPGKASKLPLTKLAWIFVAWVAGATLYFREQWLSGLHSLMGNDGDTRLMAYLCEHWFRVLHGQASWRSPAFFYPTKGVLGWSDTYFIYQMLYAPLRLVGFSPFTSLQWTIILFSLVGFVGFVYLMRLAFRAPLLVSCIGGLIFVFPNDQYLHAGRFQLNGIYLVPLVLLCGLQAWRLAPTRKAVSLALGASCGLLWALFFFSTYYVAWFSSLAGVFLVLIWLLGSRGSVRRSIRALRFAARPLAAGVVAFALGIVPFLLTYLPVRRTTGLTYAAVVLTAGPVGDVLNVGRGNVWSDLVAHVPGVNVAAPELTYATTPLVDVLAVLGGILCGWRLLRHSQRRLAAAQAAVLLSSTAVLMSLLPFRSRFFTPWAVIWHLPGASAMRAIDRLEVVTAALAVTAIVAAASEVAAAIQNRPRVSAVRIMAVAILVLAAVEQINTTHVSKIDEGAQVLMLRSVPPPPSSCSSFYVTDSGRSSRPSAFYQIDAMLISQAVSLPTLNGYTGYSPKGWLLDDLFSPDYQARVHAWARAHRLLSGLCELNLGTMSWSRDPRSVSGH